jgi:histone deacetylase 1/2
LDLIFYDVWGPAPTSVGGYKYYISFIDDFSKFSWIYLMHDRSEAPHIFMQFKTHVERLLDTTIKHVQSDWGGEYRKMHMFLVHTHINRTNLPNASTAT